MPVLVTPTRNPNPSRVSNPLWWLVNQLLANWPGSTNSGTFAPKTGSHDCRNCQSADNYSTRDPRNRLGPGDKCAAFDQSFPTTGGMVEMGRVVADAYATNDPRAYALFEALGEADGDYDPEGFVFYPTRRTRVPDRSHKTHWHWGFIREFMGEDARSWKAMRDTASLLCREALDVWRSGRSVFADPADREDEDVQQVLIRLEGDPTVNMVTMGVGHLPIGSPQELTDWQNWMASKGMDAKVYVWPARSRLNMGPNLWEVDHVGTLRGELAAGVAADQARDAGLAAAVSTLAGTVERLATVGGGSIEAGALIQAVTDSVREAAGTHTAATTAIYNELVSAKQEIRRLQAAMAGAARGTVDALGPQV